MASYIAQSPKLSQGIWENPCLSLFNHVSIDQFRRSKKVGDVHSLIDNHIGKRVFSIRGLISLNSYIEIPNPDAPDESSRQPINAVGPFLYIQYRRLPASLATPIDKSIVMFHLDIMTNTGPLRLSVSSMFDQIKMAGHALRIPLHPSEDGRWSIFALDVPKLLEKYVSRNSEYRMLRSVKLCASMVVRDFYTSHQAFTFTNVPQEMKLPCRSSEWEDEYAWTWCPEPPSETKLTSLSSPLRIAPHLPSPSPTFKQPQSNIDHKHSSKLSLSQVVGVGCASTGHLCWRGDRVLLPAAQSLMMFYSNSIQSLCCHHHSPITSICFSHDTTLFISAQDDGVVSLWEVDGRCLWREKAHIITSAFSTCDKFAVIATKDASQRVGVSLWDLRALKGGPSNHASALVSRLTGDFDINRLVFMPNDNTRFISCGLDNIRYWRLNKGKLQGCSCIGDTGRGEDFTDMCFLLPGSLLSVTVSGKMFTVDVSQRKVMNVFQLHDSPISCVVMAGQYVLTGDSQGYLRAWASDGNYEEYTMQAQYESAIISVAVNADASRVATASSHGCLGVLDIATQQYSTLLQCHRTGVNAIALSNTQIATSGLDTTLRLVEEGGQLAEFHIDNDAPCQVAICPIIPEGLPNVRLIACGYKSGAVRIVSTSSSSSLFENHIKNSPIQNLVFSRSGKLLYALDSDSSMSIFNVTNDFTLIKSCSLRPGAFLVAVTDDGGVAIATCSNQEYSVSLFDETLSIPLCTLELPPKCKLLKMMFASPRHKAISSPSRLLVLTSKTLLKFDVVTEGGSIKPQVVFRLSQSDVTVAELAESGVVWLDPKTSHLLLRTPHGDLYQMCHSPSHMKQVALSVERVVAVDVAGSIFVWERAVRSTILNESFDMPSIASSKQQGDSGRLDTSLSVAFGETSFQSLDVDASPMSFTALQVDSSQLSIHRVMGYDGGLGLRTKQNIAWDSLTGVVVYSVGHLLVIQSVADPGKQAVATQSLHINTLKVCGDKVLVGCIACPSSSPDTSFAVWRYTPNCIPPVLSLVHCFHLHNETGVEDIAVSSCQSLVISLGCWSEALQCSAVILWSNSSKMITSHQMPSKLTDVSFFPISEENQVRFVTVGTEGIGMWMLDKTDKQLHVIGRVSSKNVMSISVINDNFLMYGDSRGCLNLWSLSEEKIIECIEVGSEGYGVNSITSSKGHVFASSLCGTVKSFETSTGHLKCTSTQSFGCAVTSLTQEIHMSGQACLVGTSDGSVLLMSCKEREEVLRITGGDLKASHVKLLGGGRLLLTISAVDGSLRCWDAHLNRTVFHLQTNPPSKCVACAVGGSFGSGVMWCAISTDCGLVRLFDLINVKLQKEFSLSSRVSHLCQLHHNLLCACVDGSLVLVKLSETHQVYQVGGAPGMIFRKLVNCYEHKLVYALVVAPNGDSHVLIWHAEEDTLTLKIDVMLLGGVEDAIICPWDPHSLAVLTVNEEGSTIELHHQPDSPHANQPNISKQYACVVSSMVSYCGLIAIGTSRGELKLLNSDLEVVADCLAHMSSSSQSKVTLDAADNCLVSFNNSQIVTWTNEETTPIFLT